MNPTCRPPPHTVWLTSTVCSLSSPPLSIRREIAVMYVIGSSLWLSTEAVAFFSLPILSLFSLPACSLVSSRIVILERLSLHCSSNLKTENHWIWSTGLSTQLTPSSRREARARGSLIVLTEHTPLATRWTRGQMAYRVFSGSFRGGHRRYLSIRNHDNRSSADWIRLCPGLSKN